MFLKLFLFAIILNCVVLASCQESQDISLKQETIAETFNESNNDDNVDLSTIDNLEITVALNESLENSESTATTSVVSDGSTLNQTVDNTTGSDDLTVVTTTADNNDTESSAYDATDSTDINGEKTDSSTELVTNTNSLEVTDTIIGELTEEATEGPTVDITEETSVDITDPSVTEDPAIDSSESTVNETVTDPPTTNTPQLPTTPFDDVLCPQVPDTTEIDPKYRNETFDSYFEEFIKKNPSAKIFKSPGFPAPYAANLNCTLSVTLSNCTGVDVVIHYLDLNPFLPDTLNIRGGEEDASDEVGKQFTGRQFGIVYKIIHTTSLYIWFNSGSYTEEYQGFIMTYSPYGNDTLPSTTTEAPITIPPSEVQVYELQLVVPENIKTNETWKKFKEILASSASKFVTDQNLNYDLAHPDNVTMDIFNCPNNWPNYKNCVRLQFSIALWNLDYDPEVHFDTSIFDYELSTNSLSIMWDLYGRDDFSTILGIEEYSIPDGTYVLLLWTGVSLSIVVIFIGVLYSIWRIDIFREYRRMYTKSDDQQDILKNKSELDLSMYPIPHQPYPTLFETNEMHSGGYYDSHETKSTPFQGNMFLQEKSSINYRHAHSDPFSPNMIDFNDTQLFPDDEEDFGRAQPMSPRSKQKLLVMGAKRDESNT